MSIRFFAKPNNNVIAFPGNHVRNLVAQVNALQKKQEITDAEKFKNSVAALINRTAPRSTPSLGLFATLKPTPSKSTQKERRKTLAVKKINLVDIKPRF